MNQKQPLSVRERQQPLRERYLQTPEAAMIVDRGRATGVQKLLAAAEYSCVNLQTLRAGVPVETTVTIEGAGG